VARVRSNLDARFKDPLVVQVIAQQWKFSYRYPSFGGFETDQLVLPDDTAVVFHVTSLDVIHDFWAYQLGVKADANPDYDNIAYTETQQLGSFEVRCDELCGLWHGAMFDTGTVVSSRRSRTGLRLQRPGLLLRRSCCRRFPGRTPRMPMALTVGCTQTTRTRIPTLRSMELSP